MACYWDRGNSISKTRSYGMDDGIRFSAGITVFFFHRHVPTDTGIHPTLFSVGIAHCYIRLNKLEHKDDHRRSVPSAWSFASTPVYVFMACYAWRPFLAFVGVSICDIEGHSNVLRFHFLQLELTLRTRELVRWERNQSHLGYRSVAL
jgi:hypothetical protein